ncbi:3-hydroxybutyryl-CoA dehydrogenase [Paenibacillus cellulosilyticus]|uniref:3-hydroxybutyryl-CoA dehydrogenase n=1 Tax=Paenibacillus cellulosilyticus TaxID=375489 RepID=A0A2V2YUT1_9BACL|nr:3-hydroxyacyl-CoA dehydrogenase family protein [Paenibacillus cellulosilyticus]PWW04855.1 3-hydroxybutyryl-CoA dehydrogenase [Paenibacillus cellulosilyticus]QKS45967.1 3-hydroxyacyl-CoA dehydrogenase family protein [Paenibacillus cellulosilyticus]
MIVGVVGAGVMGSDVAQNLASCSHDVILMDHSVKALDSARKKIERARKLGSFHRKGQSGGTAALDAIERIRFVSDYAALAEVDYLIENVTERWEIKKPVYEVIDSICKDSCIFAVNTSVIPITKAASVTKRADRVIGIHFMNPVPLKPTVEVIRGYHTSEETIQRTDEMLRSMGKSYVLVQDSPGFVSNRVLMLTINEAIFLLMEQVSTAADIDRLFRECFGHTMGPLETADLIGLDTIYYSIDNLYQEFGDSKYRPCPLLKKMVDAGLHGMKSGEGFYNYND